MVLRVCNPSCEGDLGRRLPILGSSWAKVQDPTWKRTKIKKDWGRGLVVKHLPTKHKFKPQFQKRKKRKDLSIKDLLKFIFYDKKSQVYTKVETIAP
jgi:hypothetical protein